jgi:elongation factor Ts
MAEINAKDVMKLRDKTGLPMMACKAALHEAGGDVEKAEEILRKQLKGKMDSRAGRAAGEGAIKVATSREAATIVEVRAETDFTAKSEKFQAAASKVAELAIDCPSGQIAPTPAMIAAVDEVRISTGENCSIARAHKLTQDPGTGAFGTYVHHDGKTGVLVQAEGSISDETLRDICMHIAAADPRPVAVTAESLPQHVVDKERNFRIEQAMASGKPKEIAEKMVEGGMRKFYEEIALVEQPFIRDPAKKIKELVGPKARIVAFFRWAVGEEA